MSFKNYYAVLGVAPDASADDIKKKFRKLALLYHPDRNAESEFAAIRFREIQEAYETLSDSARRIIYNRTWRDHYPKVNLSVAEETGPESVLLKCKKLQQEVRDMDIFRINQSYIQSELNKVLSGDAIALLLFHNDKAINKSIIMCILEICVVLPAKSLSSIQDTLNKLAGDQQDISAVIQQKIKQLIYKKLWEQYYPVLAFIIAIAACIIIYFLSR
ncbi:MAG: J domain-containing protein [Chitinophagaceae bacterium]|nr:J domain-containing protein [Chitinophagaceae bacterium]